MCYVWIPIFLPVKSEKLCLQCRRFPIVLHERLVKVTEVRNEANARVVYLSEAPWPWRALGFVTMATHVYRDTCASVGILPCFVFAYEKILMHSCKMRENIGVSSWRICRHCKTTCLSAQLWQALSMGQIYITLQGEGKVCCCLERFIHTYKKEKLWSHTFTGSTSSSEFELFPHASPDSAFLIQLPWPSWPLNSHTF